MKKLLAFFALLLTFLLGAAEPYQVLVLGDLHYDAPEYHADKTSPSRYAKMWRKNTPALLDSAAKQLDNDCAFVIQVGDLVTGYADSLEHQEAMLSDAFFAVKKYFPQHRLFVVKGNHDVHVTMGAKKCVSNESAARVLLPLVAKEAGFSALPTGNWSLMHRGDLYLVVDGFDENVDFVSFVDGELRAHPEARYVFLFTHLPVLPASYTRPDWLLPHYAEIARLLAARNGIIIGGHTHHFSLTSYEFEDAGRVTQLLVNSVALHWQKPDEWLPKSKNYAEYQEAMKKKNEPYEFESVFSAAGYRECVIYPQCTGYVVLDISDEEVTAFVYNGADRFPHELVLQSR